MGVTIHFRGRMNPKIKTKELYILSSLICREFKWWISEYEDTEHGGHLFEIRPHENCEPLIFRLNPDGDFGDHCKTQFAPLEVHKNIISLFDQVKIKLSELVIRDEGQYWESRKDDVLLENIKNCYLAIEKAKEEDPEYYGPVKNDDGRIADLVK